MAQPNPETNNIIDPLQFALDCARIADENKAEDIVVLDLRGRSPICDFFVICTGTSDRQMQAAADYMAEHAKKVSQPRLSTSGYEQGIWILIDFVDVLAHLFDEAHRRYYDLELLWGDCPKIPWQTDT